MPAWPGVPGESCDVVNLKSRSNKPGRFLCPRREYLKNPGPVATRRADQKSMLRSESPGDLASKRKSIRPGCNFATDSTRKRATSHCAQLRNEPPRAGFSNK